MKKLICTKEVEEAEKQGQKVIYIDENTLVTPAAKDAAINAGIEFVCGQAPEACVAAPAAPAEPAPAAQPAVTHAAPVQESAIDSELIYKAIMSLAERGLLGNLANVIQQDVPYVSEGDGQGFVKLVRSSTAKWEPLDTGNPADKVFYNELINSDDGSAMNAGFMTIENCSFPWDVACQEIYYVVEGTLTVEKDGRVFTGHPGDCLFFQNGAHLKFGSPDKVKVFYATH